MTKRTRDALLILALLVILCVPVFGLAVESPSVLILYEHSKTMEALSGLITAAGAQPVSVKTAAFTSENLNDCAVIFAEGPLAYALLPDTQTPIICVGAGFNNIPNVTTSSIAKTVQADFSLGGSKQSTLITSPFDYISSAKGKAVGTIRIAGKDYPLAVISSLGAFLPYFNPDDLSAFAAADLLQSFIGSQEDPKIYVMIDEVYPFDDLNLLRKTADIFFENGIPFVCSVMPVYENTDLSAFNRFVDTLLYMRAKGASFVLHDPVTAEETQNSEALKTKIDEAVRVYHHAGIDIRPFAFSPYAVSPTFLSSLRAEAPNELRFPVDVMVVFPVFSDEAEVEAAVNLINDKRVTVSDYDSKATYIYGEEAIASSPVSTAVSDASVETKSAFSDLVQTSGRVFTVIIIVSFITVLVLIAIGYQLYINKFLKKK